MNNEQQRRYAKYLLMKIDLFLNSNCDCDSAHAKHGCEWFSHKRSLEMEVSENAKYWRELMECFVSPL